MQRQVKGMCVFAMVAGCLASSVWRAPAQEQTKGDAQIQRGAYLVNEVAHCGECHTPRDAKGKLDSTKHLQGSPIWFTSKYKFKKWEDKVPDITANGVPTKWGTDKLVKFLSTGVQADMPMPSYRLTVDDAKAVTAYLLSLPGAKK